VWAYWCHLGVKVASLLETYTKRNVLWYVCWFVRVADPLKYIAARLQYRNTCLSPPQMHEGSGKFKNGVCSVSWHHWTEPKPAESQCCRQVWRLNLSKEKTCVEVTAVAGMLNRHDSPAISMVCCSSTISPQGGCLRRWFLFWRKDVWAPSRNFCDYTELFSDSVLQVVRDVQKHGTLTTSMMKDFQFSFLYFGDVLQQSMRGWHKKHLTSTEIEHTIHLTHSTNIPPIWVDDEGAFCKICETLSSRY